MKKYEATLVGASKETVQHSHRNLESLSHLNNMSFLCYQSLSNHPFRRLCKEMQTEQPRDVLLRLHAETSLIR